jgi:hypothetical protein
VIADCRSLARRPVRPSLGGGGSLGEGGSIADGFLRGYANLVYELLSCSAFAGGSVVAVRAAGRIDELRRNADPFRVPGNRPAQLNDLHKEVMRTLLQRFRLWIHDALGSQQAPGCLCRKEAGIDRFVSETERSVGRSLRRNCVPSPAQSAIGNRQSAIIGNPQSAIRNPLIRNRRSAIRNPS